MSIEKKVEKINQAAKTLVPKDWVETAAYFHWNKRGRPHGDDFADWMKAEAEILDLLEISGALKPGAPALGGKDPSKR